MQQVGKIAGGMSLGKQNGMASVHRGLALGRCRESPPCPGRDSASECTGTDRPGGTGDDPLGWLPFTHENRKQGCQLRRSMERGC